MLSVNPTASLKTSNRRYLDDSAEDVNTSASGDQSTAVEAPPRDSDTLSEFTTYNPKVRSIITAETSNRHPRFTGTILKTEGGPARLVQVDILNYFFKGWAESYTNDHGQADEAYVKKRVRDMFCLQAGSGSKAGTEKLLSIDDFDRIWHVVSEALDDSPNSGNSVKCLEFGEQDTKSVDITGFKRNACIASLARTAAQVESDFLRDSKNCPTEEILTPFAHSPTSRGEAEWTDKGVYQKDYWGPGWKLSIPK